MGIDLRGLHIGVAEQLLHGPDVLAALQQMCGEGMAQGMRRRRLVQANPAYGIANRPLNGLFVQMMAKDAAGTRVL